MTQETILRILTGTLMIAKNTSTIIKDISSTYIEKNFIKGNYVSREEFGELKKLVIKMDKQLSSLSLAKKK